MLSGEITSLPKDRDRSVSGVLREGGTKTGYPVVVSDGEISLSSRTRQKSRSITKGLFLHWWQVPKEWKSLLQHWVRKLFLYLLDIPLKEVNSKKKWSPFFNPLNQVITRVGTCRDSALSLLWRGHLCVIPFTCFDYESRHRRALCMGLHQWR